VNERNAIRHIVLAYDASEESDHAFEYARLLAQRFDAALDVVWVISPPALAEGAELTAALEEGAVKAKEGLRRLRHVTRGESFTVRFLTKVGRPFGQILTHAAEVDADLIVVGHRRRTLMERGFRGSTVIKVIEAAGCPVLVVR
jgi:nucleotide-binding universal stress UspA family protein